MHLKISCKAKDLQPYMKFILSTYGSKSLVVDMKALRNKKIPVEW